MSADRRAVDAVEAAVDQARQRLLRQLGLREALLALTIALAGPVLLLLFGTSYFPSVLLALFVAGGAAWAVYRLRAETPSPYRAAQALDERWSAQDQISTAYFFREHPAPEAARQRQLAVRAVNGDVGAAFPMEWPRTGWAAAGALVLTLALFAARVSVMPQLSFEPPLAPLLFPALAQLDEDLLEESQVERAEAEDAAQANEAFERAEATETAERPEPLEVPFEPEADSLAAESAAFEMPEVEGLTIPEELGDELAGSDQQASEGEAAEQGESTESASAEKPEGGSDWSEDSNNLLDRLQEAFKDMMESMNMDPPESQQGEQQAGQGEQSSQEPSDSGEQAQADSPGDQASDAEMEGGEPTDAETEQTAQGQGSSDSEQGGQQGESASASGSAEGSKEIDDEQAQREAAMNTLEEFFQERAEQVKGEITVETSEAEQSVATPYRNAAAGAHTDRGGAVTRDEIPLAYQRFIENYFRNIRKQESK